MKLNKLLLANQVVKDELIMKIKMNMPDNLLLYGSNATGKTTIAHSIVVDLGLSQSVQCEFDETNYSEQKIFAVMNAQRLDTQRNGLIIINEVDRLKRLQQYQLQSFIDTYCSDASNKRALCRVILTTNNKNDVIPALISRCCDYHIQGPTPATIMPLFVSKLRSEGVPILPSAATALLATTLSKGAKYLSYRDVERLFIKTVFSATKKVAIWTY